MNRHEALKISATLFSSLALLVSGVACASQPTPEAYRVPTVDASDVSPWRDFSRFYPEMRQFAAPQEFTLNTAIPTKVYSFLQNRKFNPDATAKMFDFFTQFITPEKKIDYPFDNPLLSAGEKEVTFTSKHIAQKYVILVPMSKTAAFDGLPKEITAITYYDKDLYGLKSAYSFIKINDDNQQIEDPEQTDFRKFAAETCNASVAVYSTFAHAEDKSKALEEGTWLQDAVCNAVSYALESRRQELTAEKYAKKFKMTAVLGLPMYVFPSKDYDKLPVLNDVIN